MTEWGYGGEAFVVKGLWKAVNASCPDACLPSVWTPTSRWHLFQYLPHTLKYTQTHTQYCYTYTEQTGIGSDTSSERQLWDWAQKWGLSLTDNPSVCLPSSPGLSRSFTCYIVPPPANPNTPFFLINYPLWPSLKPSSALSSVSTAQIGAILLKAPHSAAVTIRQPAGGNFIVP